MNTLQSNSLVAQVVKNLPTMEETWVRSLGSIPGWERSPGEGNGNPLQHSWASLVAQLVKNLPTMWETWVRSLVGEIPWRREWQPTPAFLSFPGGSAWASLVAQVVKNLPAMWET